MSVSTRFCFMNFMVAWVPWRSETTWVIKFLTSYFLAPNLSHFYMNVSTLTSFFSKRLFWSSILWETSMISLHWDSMWRTLVFCSCWVILICYIYRFSFYFTSLKSLFTWYLKLSLFSWKMSKLAVMTEAVLLLLEQSSSQRSILSLKESITILNSSMAPRALLSTFWLFSSTMAMRFLIVSNYSQWICRVFRLKSTSFSWV